MARYVLYVLLFVPMFVGCSTSPSDEQCVKDVFQAYRKALLDQNGEAAWSYIDSHTANYYGDMLSKSLSLPRDDLDRLELISQFMVLRLRLEFKKSKLESMTNKDVFVIGVQQGWIGKSTVEGIVIDRIEINGHTAIAFMAKAPNVPLFHFIKEADNWKLSLVRNLEMPNLLFVKMLNDSGLSEREFLIDLLSSVSIFQVDEKIFDGPLQ